MKVMQCPICGALKSRKVFELYDDRYGYPGKYPLYRCPECDHKFLGVGFTADQLSELYTNYYPRSSYQIQDHNPHQERSGFFSWLDGVRSSAFRWVPCNVRVLDVGCGFGETLGYHQTRGCDVHGVEADENIRRIADKFGYKVHVGLFNPELYTPASFDYVTFDQVLEHVQSPNEIMRGIAQILKSGGVAVISVPNSHGWGARLFGKKWINWHAPYHMQFYSARSIELALKDTQLALEKTVTVTSSDWLSFQWIHLITYPSIGISSPFWTHEGKFTLKQKLLIRAISFAHRCKINHIITRLFDALNLGDNRLYFLRKK